MSCGATCHIADNYGDNDSTHQCQLEAGHSGRHREDFRDGGCTLKWKIDERHEDRPSAYAKGRADGTWEWERDIANPFHYIHVPCKGAIKSSDEFDSYYCEKCNVWLENKCEAIACEYCENRPEKPK